MICTACGRPAHARNLCAAHYRRLRKTGEVGPAELRPPRGCDVPGCNGKHQARGLCAKHYMRLWEHGAATAPVRGEHGAIPGYGAIHRRMRETLGRAATHLCRHCDAPAAEWAYDHSDPNELIDARGRPYSLDAGRYVALCIPCHRSVDR